MECARDVGELVRIPLFAREKAAIVKLRRFGYSINLLARMFSRSRSLIKRCIDFNVFVGNFRKLDLRKLPTYVKHLGARRLWATWLKLARAWSDWIAGSGERPP
jgi:hypothetical protein